MIVRILRISLLIVLCYGGDRAYSQSTFNKYYNCFVDGCFSVVETNSGYIFPVNSLQSNFSRIVKLNNIDKNGNLIWSKSYGNSNQDAFLVYKIHQVEDSNYVYGSAYDVNSKSHYFLQKVDKNGDSLWFKKYDPDSGYHYRANYFTKTSDNGFLICGQKVDFGNTNGNAHILRVDSAGNYMWDQEYFGLEFDVAYSAVELPDKGFLVAGWSKSYGAGTPNNPSGYLIRTDSMGTKLWHKSYGSSGIDGFIGINTLKDGNFIISGSTGSVGSPKAWLLKVDINGNVIWNKSHFFGNSTFIDSWWATELDNGDFIAGSAYRKPSNLKDDGLIFRTDSSGEVIWYRTFTVQNNHAFFRDVIQTTDGGFIAAGFVFDSPNTGDQDAWIVKVDSSGCDSLGCANYTSIFEKSDESELILVYPNPTSSVYNIQLDRLYDKFAIRVFNLMGEMISQDILYNKDSFQGAIQSNSGLYLIQIITDGQVIGSVRILKHN